MIEQTLFALPFALIGVLFAGGGSASQWLLVIVAFTAARSAGMSFNRAIDAEIDAKNPRTSDRLIPSGELKKRDVWIAGIVSSIILIGSSYMINELCFYLSFLAVVLLFTYSFFKRFSSSSHFYLGLVEAAAPIGGYVAITGKFTATPFILGFIILFWIAGLDIVYAIQDKEFDVKTGLRSIPARLGSRNALMVSAACYILSAGAMVAIGIIDNMNFAYWLAICCIGFIFIYQQKLARSEDINEGVIKFFKANMYVSPALFLGTFIDVVILKLYFNL